VVVLTGLASQPAVHSTSKRARCRDLQKRAQFSIFDMEKNRNNTALFNLFVAGSLSNATFYGCTRVTVAKYGLEIIGLRAVPV
jgi:hypothetical protein